MHTRWVESVNWMREATSRIYAARQLPASRCAHADLCFGLLVKRGCGAVRPFVDLTRIPVLSAFEPAANRSDKRRRWIVSAVLLLSLVYDSPIMAS
jgi:hypothetical protein